MTNNHTIFGFQFHTDFSCDVIQQNGYLEIDSVSKNTVYHYYGKSKIEILRDLRKLGLRKLRNSELVNTLSLLCIKCKSLTSVKITGLPVPPIQWDFIDGTSYTKYGICSHYCETH